MSRGRNRRLDHQLGASAATLLCSLQRVVGRPYVLYDTHRGAAVSIGPCVQRAQA